MQLRQRPDTNRRHFHYGKCWKKYLLLYRAVEVTPWPMWVMTHSWIACLGCGVGHPQFTSEKSLFEPPIDGMSDFAGVLCTGCWNLRSYSRASKHDSFGSPHRTTRLPNLKNVLICFLFFFLSPEHKVRGCEHLATANWWSAARCPLGNFNGDTFSTLLTNANIALIGRGTPTLCLIVVHRLRTFCAVPRVYLSMSVAFSRILYQCHCGCGEKGMCHLLESNYWQLLQAYASCFLMVCSGSPVDRSSPSSMGTCYA